MIRIVLWRHGITAWNQERRIQGQTDEPLCDEGRDELRARNVPPGILSWRWVSSPLARTYETAMILSGRNEGEIPTDPRLKEMDWGEWEGELLEDLRSRFGGDMAANELRGLHFRPTGGECPADVQKRALELVAEVAASGCDHSVVTHKGVIRALMAHALDWDMTGKPPIKLQWSQPHLLRVDKAGQVVSAKFNLVGDEADLA